MHRTLIGMILGALITLAVLAGTRQAQADVYPQSWVKWCSFPALVRLMGTGGGYAHVQESSGYTFPTDTQILAARMGYDGCLYMQLYSESQPYPVTGSQLNAWTLPIVVFNTQATGWFETIDSDYLKQHPVYP